MYCRRRKQPPRPRESLQAHFRVLEVAPSAGYDEFFYNLDLQSTIVEILNSPEFVLKESPCHLLFIWHTLLFLPLQPPPTNPLLRDHGPFDAACLPPARNFSFTPLLSFLHVCRADDEGEVRNDDKSVSQRAPSIAVTFVSAFHAT